MASDSGVPNERLDERLAAARDSALLEGEEVVAQVEGDQGQGIVLTNSRVLVIKVGITATGVANGKVVGEFCLPQISAVNVRKGPLGAVIQICTEGKPPAEPGAAPDNVIVFTGSQRMRKCESFAAKIESALGKPVGRVESPDQEPDEAVPVAPAGAPVQETPDEQGCFDQPSTTAPQACHSERSEESPGDGEPAAVGPESPPEPALSDVARGTHQPRSLAEEMFAEIAQAQSQATQPSAEPVPAMQSVGGSGDGASQPVEPTPDAEPPEALHANPNLPKPVHRRSGRDKVLVLFGLLIAAVAIGVAAMAPLRIAEKTPTVSASSSDLSSNTKLSRRQRDNVARYAKQAQGLLDGADRALAALESALGSNNKAAMAAAVRKNAVDSAWRKVNALKAPPGLAGAKEQLVSGLFIGKTAVADLSGALQSPTFSNGKDLLRKIAEARSLIRGGMASIGKTITELNRRLADEASPPKRRGDRALFTPRRTGQ